jgi:transposase-like protein
VIPKKNPKKGKRYSDEEKKGFLALIYSGQMTRGQLIKKTKLGNATVESWQNKFPRGSFPLHAEPQPPEPQKGSNGEPAAAPGTALVTFSRVSQGKNGRYSNEDRDRVLALIDKGKSILEASELSGVPDNTLYGWLTKRRKKAALSVQRAEPIPVQISPGVTAVLGASQRAFVMLRQARTSKLDAIRNNQSGAAVFSDEFCYSQLAHNELARVLGMK